MDRTISGEWRGSYFCYPDNRAFTLTVKPVSTPDAALSVTLATGSIEPGKSGGAGNLVEYKGTYDPASRTLSLVPDRSNRGISQLSRVSILLDGERLVGHFLTSPGLCTFLVGDRAGGLFAPDDVTPEPPPQQRRAIREEMEAFLRGVDTAAMCGRIHGWSARYREEFPSLLRGSMSPIYAASQLLAGDEEFTAFFGKRFDALSLAEREGLLQILRRNCRETFSRDENGLKMALERLFTDRVQGGRRQALSAVHGFRHLRAWRDDALAEVESLPVSPGAFEVLKGLRQAGDVHLKPLWPTERAAFLEAIDRRTAHIAPAIAMAEARHASEMASGYDGAMALLAWPEHNAELLGLVPVPERGAAIAVVNGRLHDLLKDLSRQEIDGMPVAGTDMAALDANSAWYEGFRRRYATLMGSDRLSGVLHELRSRRGGMLAALAPELVAGIEAANDAKGIDALLGRVLAVPGDAVSEGGRRIRAAGDSRKRELDERRFMARFSTAEQKLMSSPGRLVVPDVYPPPTAEEVRLAILREIASMGGSMVDERRALLAIPPFGALGFNIEVTVADAANLSCTQAGPGYECAYHLPMRNRLPDGVREFFAGNPLYTGIIDLAMKALQAHGGYTGTDRFVLTQTGWRSPTAEARRLEGIVAHYQAIAEAQENHRRAYCNPLVAETDMGRLICN